MAANDSKLAARVLTRLRDAVAISLHRAQAGLIRALNNVNGDFVGVRG